MLLTFAAGALSVTIVAMWSSLQQMGEPSEMTFEQALSFAAPTATEEQKRALLRTLKDLEYELSVGKISREDYEEVSAEIRNKAKEMIALSDEAMKERLAAAEKRWARHAKMDGRRPGKSASGAPQNKKKGKDSAPPQEAAPPARDKIVSAPPTLQEGLDDDLSEPHAAARLSIPDEDEDDLSEPHAAAQLSIPDEDEQSEEDHSSASDAAGKAKR
jgi:hypothetical protein